MSYNGILYYRGDGNASPGIDSQSNGPRGFLARLPSADDLVVVLVVALLSLLVSAIVLHGVLNPVPKPFVRLSQPTFNMRTATATIPVQTAFPGRGPASFKIDVAVNGSAASRVDMPSGSGSTGQVAIQTNGTMYFVRWNDTDANGQLSAGDKLDLAYSSGGIPYGYPSYVALDWTDGSILASVSFAWPHPSVSLKLAANLTSHADLWVSDVQAPKHIGPTSLGVSLQATTALGTVTNGTTAALATPAGTPTVIRMGNTNYTIVWMNPNGTGNLSTGDHFTVSYPSGQGYPINGTTIALWLIWIPDGVTFFQIDWIITWTV